MHPASKATGQVVCRKSPPQPIYHRPLRNVNPGTRWRPGLVQHVVLLTITTESILTIASLGPVTDQLQPTTADAVDLAAEQPLSDDEARYVQAARAANTLRLPVGLGRVRQLVRRPRPRVAAGAGGSHLRLPDRAGRTRRQGRHHGRRLSAIASPTGSATCPTQGRTPASSPSGKASAAPTPPGPNKPPRGEDDEVGRVTLRALDNDKARNITMDLSDNDYRVAGEANTGRRMVAATGILRREPGRALRFIEVDDFHLVEDLQES